MNIELGEYNRNICNRTDEYGAQNFTKKFNRNTKWARIVEKSIDNRAQNWKMMVEVIQMIDISSFKSVPIKDENQRTPLICVTEATVAFGIGAIEALNRPRYARIVVDSGNSNLYLFGCEQGDQDAFEFIKNEKDRYVRLKSRALHRLCDKLSGLSSTDYPYRVSGKVDVLPNDQPVIVFRMKEVRKTGKNDDEEL